MQTVHIFSKLPNLLQLMKTTLHEINFKLLDLSTMEEALKELQTAEVVIADQGLIADHSLVQNLPRLEWLQGTWAGVETVFNNLDRSKPLPKYKLTRLGDTFGRPMAEYVIGQIISMERNFLGMKHHQDKHSWAKDEFKEYRLLSQLQLGILGAGDIGGQIAVTAKYFGMTVWGLVNHPSKVPKTSVIDYMRNGPAGLDEMLQHCDYIVNVLPSTPHTRGMLSGHVFSKCKQGAVFINVGRGDITDTSSLVTALDNRWISHAVLDVVEEEPLASSNPLWKHPNVTITPHVSGNTFEWQVVSLFERNWKKYQAGEELEFQVDWEKGY